MINVALATSSIPNSNANSNTGCQGSLYLKRLGSPINLPQVDSDCIPSLVNNKRELLWSESTKHLSLLTMCSSSAQYEREIGLR